MSTVSQRSGVRPKRWSKEEFYRLGELGFFHGTRVELIEGRLMVHSPQGPTHAGVVAMLTPLLVHHFQSGVHVRVQLPIDLGQVIEPEPDFAIVAGVAQAYLTAHPTHAELIVEMSDSSLAYDRTRKGSLYARAGIREYWIVNLVDHHVEVYTDPMADPTQHYGHRYGRRVNLTVPAMISPMALPGVSLAVADLLP